MIDWGLVLGVTSGCAIGTGAGYYESDRSSQGVLKYVFLASIAIAQYLYLRSIAKRYPELVESGT